MKTIIEKAEEYTKRVPNADAKSAYIEGANEALLTVIDRLRAKFEFKKFDLEDVAKVISVMRTGKNNYR